MARAEKIMIEFIKTYAVEITTLTTIVYTLFTIILVWITHKNIESYRDDKKIDEDKKLAITQLTNLYKLTLKSLDFKIISEDMNTFNYAKSILFATQSSKKNLNIKLLTKAIKNSKIFLNEEIQNYYGEVNEKSVETHIINNQDVLIHNFKIAENNLETIQNKNNNLKKELQNLNDEIRMYHILLPTQAINIHHYLFNFFLKTDDIYNLNRNNIIKGSVLTPYPTTDSFSTILEDISLNIQYIHKEQDFFLEKWKSNWQEVKPQGASKTS